MYFPEDCPEDTPEKNAVALAAAFFVHDHEYIPRISNNNQSPTALPTKPNSVP